MRGKIILVTGGARSGKSNFAEGLARDSEEKVAYLATAIPFDDGMKDRIAKHRESRPQEWTTYEGYKDVYKLIPEIAREHKVLLLDCMTVMVTNLLIEDVTIDWDNIPHEAVDLMEDEVKRQVLELLGEIRKHDLCSIIVTNETGMGIVPINRLSRIFRDVAGRINQMIAKEADEVYFAVSGIPMKIK